VTTLLAGKFQEKPCKEMGSCRPEEIIRWRLHLHIEGMARLLIANTVMHKKHFWQEKHGEKMPYGLDDIKEARDIIIVEGEFDKLSMEESWLQKLH